jgi:DNA-binding MarR family transcriptional regulator
VNDVYAPAPTASAPAEADAATAEATTAEAIKAEAAELLAAIGAVRRVARRAVRGSAEAGALPPARSELLRLAARRPGIGVAEAAQELRLAPNSVSTMVSQLAADGLLSRGRAEDDGRSVRLTVTDAGAARIGQWHDLRAELAGRALGRLAPADRQAIRAAVPALSMLAELMEEL